jgi:hypothetical protein
LRQFVGGHRREILLLQDFARRERERGIEIDLVLAVGPRFGHLRRQHRLREARRKLRRRFLVAGAAIDARQQRRDHFFQQLGIAPEEIERLLEQRQLLVPRDEDCGQRFAKIGLVGNANRLDRGNRIDHFRGSDGQAGGTQHAHEVEHVLGQPALGQDHRAVARALRRHSLMPSACTSATRRAATSGDSAPTSS